MGDRRASRLVNNVFSLNSTLELQVFRRSITHIMQINAPTLLSFLSGGNVSRPPLRSVPGIPGQSSLAMDNRLRLQMSAAKTRRQYSTENRFDIGKYSAIHSPSEASAKYSDLLGFSVARSNAKRYKHMFSQTQMYGNKNNNKSKDGGNNIKLFWKERDE